MREVPAPSAVPSEPPPPGLPLLSVDQAARALGVSRVTLYRLFAGGALPWVQVGASRRVDPADLASYIRRNKRTGAAP